jgi:hypothetical protein
VGERKRGREEERKRGREEERKRGREEEGERKKLLVIRIKCEVKNI